MSAIAYTWAAQCATWQPGTAAGRVGHAGTQTCVLQAINAEAEPGGDLVRDLVLQHPVFANINVGLFSGVLIPMLSLWIFGFASHFATRYIVALAITCGCGPFGAACTISFRLAPQSRLAAVGSVLFGPLTLAAILSDTYLFLAGACWVVPNQCIGKKNCTYK